MGRLSDRTTEIAVGTATNPAGFQSFTLGYDYDQWGNLAHLDYPHPVGGDCEMAESPSLAYTYGLTALQSVTDEDTLVQLLSGPNSNLPTFDANTGMMTEWWTRVGVNGADGWLRHQVQPDGTRSRPSSITATMNGVTPVFSSGAYAYDAVGNITGIGADWTYVYDALSRLKSATLAGHGSQSYDYDDVGNIINLNGQTIPVDSATNRLSGAGYDYDGRGNLKVEPMASGWIRHLKFDPANRLMAAWATGGANPPADRYAFAYDTSGERVVRYRVQDDVVQDAFAYLRGEGGQVLTEFQWSQQDPVTHDGAWSRIKDYVYLGSQMMTRIERTLTNPETGEFESRYVGFAQDHLGSTRAEVGSAATSSPVTFWPFGDFVESPGLLESHMFTGHEREYMGSQPDVSPLEGLDYMHARYYSSGLGRFLSVDPVGGVVGSSQSWNRYAYVRNNPIRGLDPDGRDFWDFVNGVANGFGSTMLANAGRQEPVNSHAAIGQAVGDAAAAIVGAAEVFVGTGGDIGGVALTATVAGAPAGVPVVAASTGLIVHGGTAVVTGVGNLTNTLMSSSGGTGSGKVDKVRSQIADSGGEIKVNPKTANQEGNVTIDLGEEGRINLRVETHPLEPGGEPVRHGNVELVTKVSGKTKVKNVHITE